ncbi:rRNA maturation RNase YbeY [Thioalkalicoccus limnaeus]|uniref:Endoribonuclease YbeY n=1 Tax=Thioalkalicoccus limnaeus TaxID=120681 RepID=A0ABV4BIZ2_9GAMM
MATSPDAKVELSLDLQWATSADATPSSKQCERWVTAALAGRRARAEVTLRLVDEPEGAELNHRYRGRSGPTNVLSFPFEPPPGFDGDDLLGDLVLCAPLVAREAAEQHKSVEAHWAHLVVHGVLHLLGYDHQDSDAADSMERLESLILHELGFANPYEEPRSSDDERSI